MGKGSHNRANSAASYVRPKQGESFAWKCETKGCTAGRSYGAAQINANKGADAHLRRLPHHEVVVTLTTVLRRSTGIHDGQTSVLDATDVPPY